MDINDLASYTTTAGLTTLLAGKVDTAQVLTNVPSGAVFTDTLYTHPSQHGISVITGLQAALDAKQATLTTGQRRQDPLGISKDTSCQLPITARVHIRRSRIGRGDPNGWLGGAHGGLYDHL